MGNFRKNNDIIAQMSLHFDKANTMDKGRSLDNSIDHADEIQKILEDTIATGQFGALKVSPDYLLFEPQSCKYISFILNTPYSLTVN